MKLDSLKRNECSCEACKSFCKKTPGWFRPREIPRLAKYFDLTIEEVFKKYLIADLRIVKDGDDVYVLTPVKNLDPPLEEVPLYLMESINSDSELLLRHRLIEELKNRNKEFGWDCDRPGAWTSVKYVGLKAPCIFFKDGKCEIHSLKPFECAVMRHDTKELAGGIRKWIAGEWKKSKLPKKLLKGNEVVSDGGGV